MDTFRFLLTIRFARIDMNEPRVPDGIYSDDRPRERVQRFARRTATGALVIAIASAQRPEANAQEAASGSGMGQRLTQSLDLDQAIAGRHVPSDLVAQSGHANRSE